MLPHMCFNLGSLRGVKELCRSRLRNDAYQFENVNDGAITDSVCESIRILMREQSLWACLVSR
ncbi:hypothetical protein VCR31J2_1280076 [Vibrio coralliirubri]|uniref:Uncharacterized protein n=1 Tax=Vibrio coralliirubri TaxID=1516159 RepID=A0AA87BZ27_9VIBR|nr:hypothetical protein VCR31J2_1280076 [Vibrio coralliirubri]